MNNIVQKITSDSQEVKETADVLQQVKASQQQQHPNNVSDVKSRRKLEPNLKSDMACANEIVFLPNPGFDNLRLQRGNNILKRMNQIHEMDKFQYKVKSQSTSEEYQVISTQLGWICSCADHKFRGVICKHIYAIFCKVNQEQSRDHNQGSAHAEAG